MPSSTPVILTLVRVANSQSDLNGPFEPLGAVGGRSGGDGVDKTGPELVVQALTVPVHHFALWELADSPSDELSPVSPSHSDVDKKSTLQSPPYLWASFNQENSGLSPAVNIRKKKNLSRI
jgi:hypothetical protein